MAGDHPPEHRGVGGPLVRGVVPIRGELEEARRWLARFDGFDRNEMQDVVYFARWRRIRASGRGRPAREAPLRSAEIASRGAKCAWARAGRDTLAPRSGALRAGGPGEGRRAARHRRDTSRPADTFLRAIGARFGARGACRAVRRYRGSRLLRRGPDLPRDRGAVRPRRRAARARRVARGRGPGLDEAAPLAAEAREIFERPAGDPLPRAARPAAGWTATSALRPGVEDGATRPTPARSASAGTRPSPSRRSSPPSKRMAVGIESTP